MNLGQFQDCSLSVLMTFVPFVPAEKPVLPTVGILAITDTARQRQKAAEVTFSDLHPENGCAG